MDIIIRTGSAADLTAVCDLLASNGLPTQDIDTSAIRWLVCESDAGVAGVIGVETFGDAGLLRSLAVAPEQRGTGIGAALVDALERSCRERGLRELVLLTQTAEPFFARRGYVRTDRSEVPEPIKASTEFRSLCPASATCMSKPLAALKRVLFVCIENSNRSQMAEAFAHMHGGDGVFAASAGSRPSGKVNPRAVQFMAELGYDLTRHRSKPLDDIGGEFDAVVTMGCGESCPWIPAKQRVDWKLADPKEMLDNEYRAVRDEIGARVRELLGKL